MIKPDSERPEKPVEIDQTPAGRLIIQIRAAAFFEIDYDLESIHEDMFFEYVQSPRTVLDRAFVSAMRLRFFDGRAASVSTGGIDNNNTLSGSFGQPAAGFCSGGLDRRRLKGKSRRHRPATIKTATNYFALASAFFSIVALANASLYDARSIA